MFHYLVEPLLILNQSLPCTTDVKVDGHAIKLILDSRLAGSIITKQLIDQLGYQVDQAASAQIIMADGVTKTLIGKIDDFPIEINSIIVPIKFKKEKNKPTWKAYQVSWANEDHNKLLLILSWDDNNKGKQKEELTWNTDQAWEIDNNSEELINYKRMWNDIPGQEEMCDEMCQYTILINNWISKDIPINDAWKR
ncbi:hypothetical protein G9A89_014048 [Geosiphon pyriformis]|nr:hypothetical protein G9A89_014048 [Geosiphon pyriformis]